jgi:sugar-specific transcriptional regulator TrmB
MEDVFKPASLEELFERRIKLVKEEVTNLKKYIEELDQMYNKIKTKRTSDHNKGKAK